MLFFSPGPRTFFPFSTRVSIIRLPSNRNKSQVCRRAFSNPLSTRLHSTLHCLQGCMVRRAVRGIPGRTRTGECFGCPCTTLRRTLTGTICRGKCSSHRPVRIQVLPSEVRVLSRPKTSESVSVDGLEQFGTSDHECHGHQMNRFLGRLRLARKEGANVRGVLHSLSRGNSPRPVLRASRSELCFLIAVFTHPSIDPNSTSSGRKSAGVRNHRRHVLTCLGSGPSRDLTATNGILKVDPSALGESITRLGTRRHLVQVKPGHNNG